MASSKSFATFQTKQFDIDELKTIGMQCGSRLPPASAVQAMFLYEMQRQTEAERLFQGAMFRLARDSDVSSSLGGQLANLEKQVNELQNQRGQTDIAAKVQIGKVRLDAFQVNLNQCVTGLSNLKDHVEEIEEGLAIKGQEFATTSPAKDAYADTALWCDIKELNANIDVLFNERDAMVKCLDDLSESQKEHFRKQDAFNHQIVDRLSQLENLVKRVRLDSDMNGRLNDPEFQQPTGTNIPINHLENCKPDHRVTEFVPGKPWTLQYRGGH